ncbi:MAG: bifunctional anthranilate synthase component I family protein/class IV aminotransferase [Fimbriimonadales bacterium]|nr:bifunctional anthranilate synthase component I family protein/class IV aminotransferase [Fimbriimonadales bacterium]
MPLWIAPSSVEPGHALVWDEAAQRWLWFGGPARVVVAHEPVEAPEAVEAAERHALQGGWAAGWVAYDSSNGWDQALRSQRRPGCPLAAFALYEQDPVALRWLANAEQQARPVWRPEISFDGYERLFDEVRLRLEAGDTYQANLTFRLRSHWAGDLREWFAEIAGPNPPRYAAYLHLADTEVASFSPELFLERESRTLRSRPMKGTAGHLATEASLRFDEKQRAENVMIVDMVRNDLGRVAASGGVRVPDLFTVERHGELLQMTSTVEAETTARLAEVFKAAFPCASIVGAPKVETARILAELEPSPRGLYTGAIGWIAPGGDCRFAVAIRTAVRYPDGELEYGTGGGVVWDSRARSEWDEAMLKTAVLERRGEPFALLETLRWKPDEGWIRLDEHLSRMERSAWELGLPVDPGRWREDAEAAARSWGFGEGDRRARLLLHPSGRLEVRSQPWSPPTEPLVAKPALRPVRSDDPALRIKTTCRTLYANRLAEVQPADECLLWNERGEATEFCNGNLVVRCGGRLVTPPLECGALPGILREELVRSGEVSERPLGVEEALGADEVWRVNSLAGWVRVRLQRQ